MKTALTSSALPDTRALYVTIGNEKYGPYTKEEVRKFIREDRINMKSMVWFEGLPGWVPIAQFPEFSSQVLPGFGGPAYRAGTPEKKADALVGVLAPIGRSGFAVAAGYLGLLAILPVFHLFAIVFAYLGYRDLKKNPNKRGMGRILFGLFAGLMGTALYAVVFFKKAKMGNF